MTDPIATLRALTTNWEEYPAADAALTELERRARIETRRDAWQKKTGGQVTLLASGHVVLEWYDPLPDPKSVLANRIARGDDIEAALNAAGAT